MREIQTREIDGHRYTVTPFPGRESWKVWSALGKRLGSSIGDLIGALQGNVELSKEGLANAAKTMDLAPLGAAFGKLLSGLDPEKDLDLILRMFRDTRVDGKYGVEPVLGNVEVFDLVFTGDIWAVFKVLGFVIEVNYDLPLGGYFDLSKLTAPTAPTAPAAGS